jgi:hypothetical protein
MKTETTIKLSAAIEAATGLAAIASPSLVVRYLFGAELSAGGVAIGRVAGVALLSLAIACWPRAKGVLPQTLRSLLVYNFFVGVYLGFLRANHDFSSNLLWPACAIHVVFAILLVRPALQNTDT